MIIANPAAPPDGGGDGGGGGDDGRISSNLQPPFPSHPGMKYPVRAKPSLRLLKKRGSTLQEIHPMTFTAFDGDV